MAFDGTLKFDTAIDKSGFESGIAKLGSIAKTGLTVVTGAVTAVGAGVAALGGYAVNVGKDFEGSMAQVIATMGATKDTVQDGINSYGLLKKAAADAGESTTFSASEAADALNYLALAGYSASQAAEALPPVLDLAAAGGLELAYASDLATDAMSALGIEATNENLTRFGDEMAKTASKANTSVSQLGEAILTVGGTAKALAGGTTELNAALGVLANRGIKGSEGGTALRNIILALSAPTDKAAAALENLGINAFDAEGNLRPLNEVFKDFDKSLSGMSDGEKTQVLSEIFNKVDLKSAQAMIAGCGTEFDNLAAELLNCDGAMADMAHTMNDTLEGDIKSLQSKAEAFGNSIYENISENLRGLTQKGGEYVSQLTSALKDGGFDGLANALGSVLANAVSYIGKYIPKIAKLAVSTVKSFIGGITENAPQITETLISVGGVLLDGIFSIIPQILDAGAKIIFSFADGIVKAIPEITKSGKEIINSLIDIITENLPEFLNAAEKLFMALVNEIPHIAAAVSEQYPKIAEAVLNFLPQLADELKSSFPILIAAISNSLPLIVTAICDALPDMIVTIIDILVSLTPTLLGGAVQLFTALVDAVPIILEELIPRIPEIIVAVIAALVSCTQELLNASTELFQTLVTGLAKAAGGISWGLIDLQDDIGKWWSSLFSDVKQNLANVLAKIASFTENLRDKGSNAAKELVYSMINGIASLPSKFGETGKNIVLGIWNGIVGQGGWLRERISDFGTSILENFKETFGIHSPSAVMRDSVGKYLAQGVGVGFIEEMPKVSTEIDDSALSAIQNQNLNSFQSFSGISGSNYIYSSPETKNNQEMIINAKFVVGEEVVAEGITRIVADEIDKKQGVDIQLKKRGVTA